MPMKASGESTSLAEIDRWSDGVGWFAHPDEAMQRASHAFAVDDEVWVVDPVDAAGLDDILAEFGTIAGVVVLLDRHKRDAGQVARRHDVSVHVPHWMTGVAGEFDAPVERIRTELGDTGYGVHPIIDNRLWQEAALYGESTGQLIVPEALGTAAFFRRPGQRLGVHPALRLFPPKRLARFAPRRLDVGHGAGIDTDVSETIEQAIDRSRRTAPGLYAGIVRESLFG